MPKIVRMVAFVLAVVAGVLLLISGIHGPTETYQLIIDNLPHFIQDQQILQIANMVALILITISLAGGLAVIAGGILILAGRVGIGRLLIGLGAGIGIPWLIMLAITLITTGQVASVLAEYSSTGWVGLILAFIAGAIAK
jgi:hypothetical protein